MELTYADVQDFIKVPVPTGMTTKIEAWLTAISAELDQRYGDLITEAREPIFRNIVGDAVGRFIVQPTTNINRQATGPSSVGYESALGGWFLPSEISRMDAICSGGGTVRTVRTPIADRIRYGNLADLGLPYAADESGEGDF